MGRQIMQTSIISQEIDEDTKNDPSVDLLMTRRGHLVFAWDSADEVIHIFDCQTDKQHPRVINEMEVWCRVSLEAFADLYCQTHKVRS